MKLLQVHRSPIRLFLFGLIGLLLMVTAVDVMWGHWVSTPPESQDEVLTTTGANQQRADFLWGVPMLLAGAGLFGYAVLSLVQRDPVLALRDDGVELQVGRPGADAVFVPWDAIADVYIAHDPDPDDGVPSDVVVFVVTGTHLLPDRPWDAQWDGNRLKVNAIGWERHAEDVVVHARVAMEAFRRDRHLEDNG
ncbi:MAG: hypothetical protein BMS9Abin07_0505 [Acidimicrobiia bacterium]|nr:MAG: hypothetical protein BMS9Abin07_0505 [Acidimicrobiia bacterium]